MPTNESSHDTAGHDANSNPDHRAESDVDGDEKVAGSRATGGVSNDEAPDQASTTGTTPSPEYVGRVAGDDPGDIGESGAERRAQG